MQLSKFAGCFLGLCMIPVSVNTQEDCDCAHWPWRSECEVTCRQRVEAALGSYIYSEPGELPRANFMASAAAEQIYGQGFPLTEFGFPVPSSTLYNYLERFGWVDISSLPSKEGAIAVWPTMSGLVIDDNSEHANSGQSNVRILYPSHLRRGELAVVDAQWLGEGTRPKSLVPESALKPVR